MTVAFNASMVLLDIRLFILSIASCILCSSCEKKDPVTPPQSDIVSFENDIQPLFNTKCVDCHPVNAGLNLRSGHSHSQLLNVVSAEYPPLLRVLPEDPEASLLYQKLIGNADFGTQMPQYAEPLTEEEIQLVFNWIQQGALDN